MKGQVRDYPPLETKYRDIADGNGLNSLGERNGTELLPRYSGWKPLSAACVWSHRHLLETKYRDIADGNG